MTKNTLKSTIESIVAANALIVVTLDGTFNSQTGAPVLSPRTRPDQRNSFLKQFCERVNPNEANDAEQALAAKISDATVAAHGALNDADYPAAIKFINEAAAAQDQLGQPRMYYRVKADVDLRTVAEKRAAKKAENEQKRAASKAAKEAKIAEKVAAKVQNEQPTPEPVATEQPVEITNKKGKKAA